MSDQADPGTRAVRKAIIPVAGYGTRMYPETRFIKKEFVPVVDKDGLVKPVLLLLLEELDTTGIEKICIILNPEDRTLYENLLQKPLHPEHYAKLPDRMKEYENRLRRIASKIEFAYQRDARGFGHAVLQASSFAGGEPTLLLLGDTIYESKEACSCTRQLLDAFERFGGTTVGLGEIPVEHSDRYGVFFGAWEDEDERRMKCTHVVEKPTPEAARDSLLMKTKNGDKCYGAFGAYVLTDRVFDRLRYADAHDLTGSRGEIELTDALSFLAENGSVTGYVINGTSYDLGNAEAYRRTVAEFGLSHNIKESR